MEKLILYSESASYFGYRMLDLIEFQVKILKPNLYVKSRAYF